VELIQNNTDEIFLKSKIGATSWILN
jgi:hypothetical protein